MKPLKLIIQSFGSYGKRTVVDFSELNQNLFLISGNTGSGKSTIFDAIVFALYGQVSSEKSTRKNGTDMQSQFVDYDTEPFVELTFSEKTGNRELTYTVHRQPQHIENLKRKSGTTGKSASVVLTMPDGSIYPERESDKKIIDIIKLNKKQFMSVVMIAQGEYMDMLRADTKVRKETFRQLFDTEIYREIINELKRRKKEADDKSDNIKTRIATEASHIVVPENDIDKDRIIELKKGSPTIVQTEELCLLLDGLCKRVKTEYDTAKSNRAALQEEMIKNRDALNEGKNLMRLYEQRNRAKRDLDKCIALESSMREKAELSEKINAAYEIESVFSRYSDARSNFEDIKKKLELQNSLMPDIKTKCEHSERVLKETENNYNTVNGEYNKIFERANAAIVLFNEIEMAQKNLLEEQKHNSELIIKKQNLEVHRRAFEGEIAAQISRRDELSDSEKKLIRWDNRCAEINRISDDFNKAEMLWSRISRKNDSLTKLKNELLKLRQQFETENSLYIQKQHSFITQRAGIIARDELKDGCPCPVCGSVEHPDPCKLPYIYENMTDEYIKELSEKLNALDRRVISSTEKCNSEKKSIEELKSQFDELDTKIREEMSAFIKLTDDETIKSLRLQLNSYRIEHNKRGVTIKKEVSEYNELLLKIKNNEKELKLLDEELEAVRERLVQSDKNKAALLSNINSKKSSIGAYTSKKQAESAIKSLLLKKNAAEKEKQQAESNYRELKRCLDKTNALIESYTKELPKKQSEEKERNNEYIAALADKKQNEEEWNLIVSLHSRSESASLKKEIDEYKQGRRSSSDRLNEANENIGERPEPNIELLSSNYNSSREKSDNAEKIFNQFSEIYNIDKAVNSALSKLLGEGKKISEQCRRLDTLYRGMGGGTGFKGERMDIETYVQRYYMKRILISANNRFRSMSNGEFELRLVDIEEGASGRTDSGLDMNVYSHITGKSRNVRTLSGGESFMAALSLALGIADQIKLNSSAVNLDVMFIDEGFGTLDDNSREQAVNVLKEMAEDTKLIGIISHVGALRQEIDAKLLISKDDSGSHARWEIS